VNPCPDKDSILQAYVDDELDAANVLDFEAHLKGCEGCAGYVRTLRELKARLGAESLRPPAPAPLRDRVEAAMEGEVKRGHPRLRGPRWAVPASAGAGAAAGAAACLMVIQLAGPSLQDQLIADHVRSLQADHLMDVATSDRHTVKPWFNGRIDFAPTVPDLAQRGFPLAGGRLDFAQGRPVAALVYRRRAHVINVFVMPASALGLHAPPRRTSYSTAHWSAGGLDYWAVSDIEPRDLQAFGRAFQEALRQPSPSPS
jgi:anti-sigma factor RsiW